MLKHIMKKVLIEILLNHIMLIYKYTREDSEKQHRRKKQRE